MNHDDHIADIVQVAGINVAAITISLTDFETMIRILSLVLACVYTSVKLYQAIKRKGSDE